MEFGYGLVPMIDAAQGGDILERVVQIRRQSALDLGLIVPAIRVRDNLQLGTNEYSIKIKGAEIARGEIMTDHLLAIASGEVEEEIFGIPTIEPAFGLPALWIPKSERESAELAGYSTIDPPRVIATHLTEIIKKYCYELLSRQHVQTLIDSLKETQPALVEEVVPKMFSLGEVQKVLSALLEENVPIRDMATILETLGDYGGFTHDPQVLAEYVRSALKRTLCKRFIPDGHAHVVTLDAPLEAEIAENTKQSEQGAYLAMDPSRLRLVFDKTRTAVEAAQKKGQSPIILTSPIVRRQMHKIAEQISPGLLVMSFNEIDQNVEVISEGVVAV